MTRKRDRRKDRRATDRMKSAYLAPDPHLSGQFETLDEATRERGRTKR